MNSCRRFISSPIFIGWGHLGKESIAAVGVAGNLTMVMLALTQMLGVGTTTLIA